MGALGMIVQSRGSNQSVKIVCGDIRNCTSKREGTSLDPVTYVNEVTNSRYDAFGLVSEDGDADDPCVDLFEESGVSCAKQPFPYQRTACLLIL